MNKAFFELIDLWSPDETYSNHRIPGMIVTKNGTLLAYCEARRTSSDWAMMDILLQRSEDHGRTFGEPIILACGTEKYNTVNNPVMVQDKNGRIHFLYCEDYSVNGGRVLARHSDDDGINWSEPVDITEYTLPHYRNAFALGPGHGIITRENVIIIPIWMVPKHYNAPVKSHMPAVLGTLYSKDNGETWGIGDILDTCHDVICPNEAEAALTSDGRVYINARHLAHYRARAYSRTGYSDWTQYGPDYTLIDPQCFGSVVAYDDGEHPYTLIYAGCADKVGRCNVTVHASTDDGHTFPISRLIDKERGGYVEAAVDSSAKLIYVLYEKKFGETDHLAIFNYEWMVTSER